MWGIEYKFKPLRLRHGRDSSLFWYVWYSMICYMVTKCNGEDSESNSCWAIFYLSRAYLLGLYNCLLFFS